MSRESGLYGHWIQITLNTIRIKHPNIDKRIEKLFVDFNELSLKNIFDLFLLIIFLHFISFICLVFELLINYLFH